VWGRPCCIAFLPSGPRTEQRRPLLMFAATSRATYKQFQTKVQRGRAQRHAENEKLPSIIHSKQ